MRTIRFRGKRLDNNKWIEGDLFHGNDDSMFIGSPAVRFKVKVIPHAEYKNLAEVGPLTVGMYTGLQDKKGRDIYEGDILKHSNMPVYYSVVWNTKLSSFVLYNPKEKHEEFGYGEQSPLGRTLRLFPFEIVGNLYDNPEVVKGGAV